MIDGIIAGTGNSRLAKSVPNFLQLYPTYEAFVGALIAGTLPLDIIFNSPGWQQIPDFLNKANLLKDETAALYSLQNTAVPDDVFLSIRSLINAAQTTANGKAEILVGSYTGKGTYGDTSPNVLSADFKIQMAFIKNSPPDGSASSDLLAVFIRPGTSFRFRSGSISFQYYTDWSDKTVSWYNNNSAMNQLNESGSKYLYVLTGVSEV